MASVVSIMDHHTTLWSCITASSEAAPSDHSISPRPSRLWQYHSASDIMPVELTDLGRLRLRLESLDPCSVQRREEEDPERGLLAATRDNLHHSRQEMLNETLVTHTTSHPHSVEEQYN